MMDSFLPANTNSSKQLILQLKNRKHNWCTTYKLALQIPATAVTQVADHQTSDEINEQDAGHSEDHVDDGQL